MVDCLHRRAVVLDAVDIMLGTARTGDLFQLGAVGVSMNFFGAFAIPHGQCLPCIKRWLGQSQTVWRPLPSCAALNLKELALFVFEKTYLRRLVITRQLLPNRNQSELSPLFLFFSKV